jgi:hypothetical protein
MTRTYWLSFVDPDRPRGERFLGVVVVDVTEEDAAAALAVHPHMADQEEGPWIAAAIRRCWKARVNPGGDVSSRRVDGAPAAILSRYPRLTLLSRADVDRLEASADRPATDHSVKDT